MVESSLQKLGVTVKKIIVQICITNALKLYYNNSKFVNLYKILFKCITNFDVGVKFDNFGFCYFGWYMFWHLSQNRRFPHGRF